MQDTLAFKRSTEFNLGKLLSVSTKTKDTFFDWCTKFLLVLAICLNKNLLANIIYIKLVDGLLDELMSTFEF